MMNPSDRVLVAVSGGKDSLAVWDILRRLGYEADGLYVGLGIGEYSSESHEIVSQFASQRGWPLSVVDLETDYGFGIEHGSKAAKRTPCSACGLSKRHLFNKAALDGCYDVVVTGHNLDDEAAVLFGNVLRWSSDYLGRQSPVLDAGEGFVKKVKPLVRLTERETAAYCVLSGIDYVVDECPMAAGNKHIRYKEALNEIEEQSPGSKASFYFGFLDRALPHFASEIEEDRRALLSCQSCGSPTTEETCAFCKLSHRASQPIALRKKEELPT